LEGFFDPPFGLLPINKLGLAVGNQAFALLQEVFVPPQSLILVITYIFEGLVEVLVFRVRVSNPRRGWPVYSRETQRVRFSFNPVGVTCP
jgi:hypothetical protein